MRRRRPNFIKRNMIAIIALIVVVLIGIAGYSIMSKNQHTHKATEPEKSITTQEGVKAPSNKLQDKEEVKPKESKQEKVKTEEKGIEKAGTVPTQDNEYSIVIDKGNFTLYLMDKGKEIKSFPVALGLNPGQKQKAGDMKTPTGDFTVDEIDDASYWKHDFGDGKGEIAGAYGPYFISLETGWDGIGIHGTHDPASIGHRVSEGCIRLNNSDLRILQKYVTPGTKVRIQE
ncbi:MAG: L,D-transpeptidase [Acidaminococcaceae bacterium]|nr:L,D-transpeptidase [Acidaminococcaceae bacterium]